MTKDEFNNLKAKDVVYYLEESYETYLPTVKKYVAVGRCESATDWIIKPFDRNEDYIWGNKYNLFLTRKEAEKEGVNTIKRRIKSVKQEINKYKGKVKTLEDNLLNFYQSCIEVKSE